MKSTRSLQKKPPKVIIDAGAHIGLASIYFANKYPEAKIIAIEPEENNFALLKANVAQYKMIIPVQAALWSQRKEVSLVDPVGGNWGFMAEERTISGISSGKYRHGITATTVEKVVYDHGLDKIDLFKIDIEGAEKEVFRDSSAWIEKVDAIIIELHEHLQPGCSRSFYNGSNGFDNEWLQGENIFLSRARCVIKCAGAKRGSA